jgi:GH25 family lysozyme M1 (1,4-beta-N-acetylmuramidase)
MSDFVDISAWQPAADLQAYKNAGHSIVSLRATDGAGYADPTFVPRWQQARQIGLARWAYHFARPGDPAQQARAFLARIHGAGGWQPGDVAMLDAEWFESGTVWVGLDPKDALSFAKAWFGEVLRDFPQAVPMIYANTWYLEAAGITTQTLPYVGWVCASYGASYRVAAGWQHACAWQYTDAASVPGLPTPVDCNKVTCPSAPPFGHLIPDDGELTVADLSALEKYIDGTRDGMLKLLGARLDQLEADIKFLTKAAGERFDTIDKALKK